MAVGELLEFMDDDSICEEAAFIHLCQDETLPRFIDRIGMSSALAGTALHQYMHTKHMRGKERLLICVVKALEQVDHTAASRALLQFSLADTNESSRTHADIIHTD
jgi:hypothetical protein